MPKPRALAGQKNSISENLIYLRKHHHLSQRDLAKKLQLASLFISDLDMLYKVSNGQISDTLQCAVYKTDRLIALGLLDSAMKSMSIGNASGSQTQRYIQVNQLGRLYCQLCLS